MADSGMVVFGASGQVGGRWLGLVGLGFLNAELRLMGWGSWASSLLFGLFCWYGPGKFGLLHLSSSLEQGSCQFMQEINNYCNCLSVLLESVILKAVFNGCKNRALPANCLGLNHCFLCVWH
ncbi:hypothetical protein ES332_D10G043100v1 [Gossypium tomentosum]|uniref:Uncharacterized protein n=1 Tax=Gossypium tomentosum TaxID=34277 RepID=A0A5D2J118_GOSTO|nr:hypothetical protein ES332_D10G043100v1 [Gossypium tomentosum]